VKKKLVIIAVLCSAVVALTWNFHQEKVDFSTQVKPILNKHCITCHGGVKKNGKFSLLFEEEAFAVTESGKQAIIKGHSDKSEFIRRLKSDDPEERMPYNAPPLNKEEIDLLTRWVDEGAKWGEHWAYTLPNSVEVPQKGFSFAKVKAWLGLGKQLGPYGSDMDYFIADKLASAHLSFSPRAKKEILLRRVYLDLIGLPPTMQEVHDFLKDTSTHAYEQVVDRLLARPQYGERWAAWWLDLARYADSKGYERDGLREMWAYRDWVINAFNADKPFDAFTIEQLAGDLLPNPGKDQLIATAFNRNTLTNDEGGTDNEEFRVAATMDRVSTTYQVWLSTTMECVQCHSHPYDPFKFEEYYQSLAFFNNSRDEDTFEDYPKLKLYDDTVEHSIKSLTSWVANLQTPKDAQSLAQFIRVAEPKINSITSDSIQNGALADTKWLSVRNGGSSRFKTVDLQGKDQLYIRYNTSAPGGLIEVKVGGITGEAIARFNLPVTKGYQVISVPTEAVNGQQDVYFKFSNPHIPANQSVCLVDWIAFRKPLPHLQQKDGQEKEALLLQLLNRKSPTVPVMMENPPSMQRSTHIFERGNWLVHGDKVQPDVPKVLNPFPKNAPRNRLGFAQWVVDKKNPLTARTVVNRLWEQIYGKGLVETLEDMGTQSSKPTHPELLDWLSLRFMNEMNWSIKKLLKEMVMSTTYQQSSAITDELMKKDPENHLYARGPRFRLSAEQIRDQILAVSDLLSSKMLGPSVMPYQPEGIWMAVYNGEEWKMSPGEDRYRRSLYTFIRRTSPYPALISFDASSREVCLVRRLRTNTPLQALTTLNDPECLEAAQALAKKVQHFAKGNVQKGIAYGYEQVMKQALSPAKLEALEKLYGQAMQQYAEHKEQACELLHKKQFEQGDDEQAAYTIMVNALLNLDEFLTKS